MKKIILPIIGLLIIAASAFAVERLGSAGITIQNFIPLIGSSDISGDLISTNNSSLGSSSKRWGTIWAQNLDSLLLTIGSYASGNLAVAGDLFVNGADINLGTGSATTTFTAVASGVYVNQNFGFGSTSPQFAIASQGPALITGTSTFGGIVASSTLQLPKLASGSVACVKIQPDGTLANSGAGCGGSAAGNTREVQFNNAGAFGGSDQFILTAGNLVGIGTGTPGTALSVIGGGVFTDKVMAPVFYATSTEASIFKGGITITCTGCITDANAVDTLTLTNITQIGTRPITSLTTSATAGRIFFSDGTNPATGNRLQWDNTNEFLGVATATPGSHLSVHGDAFIRGTTTMYGLLTTSISATSSLGFYPGGSAIPAVTAHATSTGANNPSFGVGTTSPTLEFSVEKGAYFGGPVRHPFRALTIAATTDVDCSIDTKWEGKLTIAVTLNFVRCMAGDVVGLRLIQDATGGRVITWPAGITNTAGTHAAPANRVLYYIVSFRDGGGTIMASTTADAE